MVKLPSVEHVRHLYVMQRTAKSKAARSRARNEFNKIVTQMQGTANSRLRTLRASDYAYGTTYDTTENYLSQTGRKYFTKPTELAHPRRDASGEAYPLTAESYEYALRLMGFVGSKESTITGQKLIEKKRFETYRKQYQFAQDMTDEELRGFLKFLGNSHVDEYLDYFGGTSGEELEELANGLMHADKEDYRKIQALFERFHNFQIAAKEVDQGKRAELPTNSRFYIDFSSLRKELSATYESIEKRQR